MPLPGDKVGWYGMVGWSVSWDSGGPQGYPGLSGVVEYFLYPVTL